MCLRFALNILDGATRHALLFCCILLLFFLPNEAYDVFRDPPSGKKCGGFFPEGWSGEGVVRGEGHQKVFYFFDGVPRNLEALPRFIMHKNKSKTMLVSFSNKFPPEKIQITPPTPRHA